jgi:hypothetical protein
VAACGCDASSRFAEVLLSGDSTETPSNRAHLVSIENYNPNLPDGGHLLRVVVVHAGEGALGGNLLPFLRNGCKKEKGTPVRSSAINIPRCLSSPAGAVWTVSRSLMETADDHLRASDFQ